LPVLVAVDSSSASLQKKQSDVIHDQRHALLLEKANQRNRARLRAVSQKNAGSWLLAMPIETLGLRIRPEEMRCLLLRHLGLPLSGSPRSCPRCHTQELDVYGDHAISCATGGDRIHRHDALRDRLHGFISAAGLTATVEERNIVASSSRRPGDIFIRNWTMGRPAALDVTVTSPLQASLVSRAAEIDGAAANVRETSKDVKNAEACDEAGVDFIPLAVETFGGWAPQARAAIKKIAGYWGARKGRPREKAVNEVHQTLSVTLQRGNAAMMVARF
jgi:hypothetical protein